MQHSSNYLIFLLLGKSYLCHMKVQSILAELIRVAKLIVWDEAPMSHRHGIDAIDRTLRDIMKRENPDNEKAFFGNFVNAYL
jgi:hypothetical protein